MASVSKWPKGGYRVRFSDPSGKQKTIYLGDMTKRHADQVRRHVEELVSAAISRCPMADETAKWVGDLDDVMRGKLSAVGLIATRETATLEAFIRGYIKGRNRVKPNTVIVWNRCLKNMLGLFDGNRALQSFSQGDCLDFREHLLGCGLAEATVRRTCGVARQIFENATERGLIPSNPFKCKNVPVGSIANELRQVYVSREWVESVIAACHDPEWKLLIALARFGGLRNPSETLSLRWSDVRWEGTGRITVHSPKTEHHRGGASRAIPIFRELRPYLQAVRDATAPDAEWVITRYRCTADNLRTQLCRIVEESGADPWVKPWQNLRASCETDLAREYPIKSVCSWLGNSVAVASRHYLMQLESDADRATGLVTQNVTMPVSETGGQEMTALPRTLGKSLKPSVLPRRRVGVTGIELDSVTGIARNDLGKHAVLQLPESMPSEVVISPEVWASLPEHVREMIRGKTK